MDYRKKEQKIEEEKLEKLEGYDKSEGLEKKDTRPQVVNFEISKNIEE